MQVLAVLYVMSMVIRLQVVMGDVVVMRVLHAEPLAMLRGLLLAQKCIFCKVYCETNYLEAYRVVQSLRIPLQHVKLEILVQIQVIVLRNWCIRFKLIHKEANNCADHMARKGAIEGTDFGLCTQQLDKLHDLLRRDVIA